MKILNYPSVLISLFLLFALASLGRSQAFAYDANLSVGNLCEYIGRIQTDDKGSTNVCSFRPYLGGAVDYLFFDDQLILSPEITLSIPKSNRDSKITKTNLVLLANAKYKVSIVHFVLGTGLFITRIAGDGGTETLKNGNSTDDFPVPEGSAFTRNFIINAGFGVDFNQKWSADLHTYIFNLTKSEDRSFSLALSGTYHFGEF